MKYLTVVQHTQSEYLGLIEDHLEGRRIRFGYARPFTADGTLPHPDLIGDGLVLLGGGPWGTAGDRDVPTLDDEITLARTCLMLEKPVIGIGLGALLSRRLSERWFHRVILAVLLATAVSLLLSASGVSLG